MTQYTSEDFTMHAGDTKYLDITVTDSATDLPLSVEDYTFRWKLESRPAVEKESGDGIAVLSSVLGILRVSLEPDDTAGLAGKFRHQLEGEDGDGGVFTLNEGVVTVRRSVVP